MVLEAAANLHKLRNKTVERRTHHSRLYAILSKRNGASLSITNCMEPAMIYLKTSTASKSGPSVSRLGSGTTLPVSKPALRFCGQN